MNQQLQTILAWVTVAMPIALSFARDTIGIVSEGFGKKLYGDAAAQFGVCCLVHITHAARSQVRCDFIVREFCADHGGESYPTKLKASKSSATPGRLPDRAALFHSCVRLNRRRKFRQRPENWNDAILPSLRAELIV